MILAGIIVESLLAIVLGIMEDRAMVIGVWFAVERAGNELGQSMVKMAHSSY